MRIFINEQFRQPSIPVTMFSLIQSLTDLYDKFQYNTSSLNKNCYEKTGRYFAFIILVLVFAYIALF